MSHASSLLSCFLCPCRLSPTPMFLCAKVNFCFFRMEPAWESKLSIILLFNGIQPLGGQLFPSSYAIDVAINKYSG